MTGLEIMPQADCFSQGSTWLRADFHLHTRADKEFNYPGEDDRFITDYVAGLQAAGIRIGVITNHNKFDLNEFKALKKKASKEDIFLLPGIELSVKEGSNGVHMLVVFSEGWITNGQDAINPFLNSQFIGKTPDQYEHENGRSNHDILTTLKNLESCHKPFFVIFAHVEQKSGLWQEVGGGLFGDLGKNPLFRKYTLGFQKVRTHDQAESGKPCRTKVQGWLKDWYPAEVEGCDAKSIDQLGKKDECTYLKLGAFDFDAMRLALADWPNRVSSEPSSATHSHIRSIRFAGGLLDKKAFTLSSGLNCLIGIRGSGKSSLLEAIRYALNLPFGQKAQDTKYKEDLIPHLLGSGGKIVVEAVDQHGQAYQIQRVLNQLPDVYVDGQLKPGVSINETILYKPLYFGQKDLSATGEGFANDLVEKLVAQKLVNVRNQIEGQKQLVLQAIDQLNRLSGSGEKQLDYTQRLQDVSFKLDFFKQQGVEDKLREQVEFNRDVKKCEQVDTLVKDWIQSINTLLSQFEDELNNQSGYRSQFNSAFFVGYFKQYQSILHGIDTLKTIIQQATETNHNLYNQYKNLLNKRDLLKESFAQIERKLAESIQEQGKINIRPDEFVQLSKDKDNLQQLVEATKKQGDQAKDIRDELIRKLVGLNDLWLKEFRLIQGELEKINNNQTALQIEADFKGDKLAMQAFMQSLFRGSGLRETFYGQVCQGYSDFGDVYRELDKVAESTTKPDRFKDYFAQNLKDLLTWQVPNDYTVNYHGKPLQDHSLGQRASAMMLFILSRQDNDLILIDQPEDDLDNQTIYQDVIKLIRQIKGDVQFVFATHNANFPVLGDAEQVMSCTYHSDQMDIKPGSIDCPNQQKAIINIMEGGAEAFNRRNEIYQLWKP